MQLINNVVVKNNRCEINIGSSLKEQNFVLEDFFYEVDGQDLSDIPNSILITPFILNIAPVVWVSGLELKINELDSELNSSLIMLKNEMSRMYPEVNFDGCITAKSLIATNDSTIINKDIRIALFSGGLDSLTTFIRHKDKLNGIVTIKGADIKLNDEDGWKLVSQNSNDFALKYKKNSYLISSNFRDFLNAKKLSNFHQSIPNWWGFVQHGMGLTGLTAIPCFLEKASFCLISSTHTKEFSDQPWGSTPFLDNKISWSSVKVLHDSYELSRQDKLKYVHEVCTSDNDSLALRVCYISEGGNNCCECEKCLRTITGLIVAGANYKKYGFNISEAAFLKNSYSGFRAKTFKFEENEVFQWNDITKDLKPTEYYRQIKTSENLTQYLEWLRLFDFVKYSKDYKKSEKSLIKKFERLFFRIKSKIYRTMKFMRS